MTFKMRLLLGAAAPLVFTLPAMAQVSISTATTAPVRTSTANSGAASDISITTAGSITLTTPAAGTAAVTIDSNNSVTNAGTIAIPNTNDVVGIRVSPNITGNDVANHSVDVELHSPTWPGHRPGSRHGDEGDERIAAAVGPNPAITWRYEQYFTARGFAVVYAESLGSGQSTGCPTSGGRNETIGARSVVDWLNGRARGQSEGGDAVRATWSTGSVGMMGVSYNGTLPNAVATTGVRGLDAIVPIAAISSWYDYYLQDGAVVAPGTYQGEDLDVLAEYVYTRADREICKPVIEEIRREQDRVTGDYSPFWHERNYLKDVHNVRAATLVVHGLNDWNVKDLQAQQWYEAIKEQGVPHKIWWHQSGHADPYSLRRDEWLVALNRWFTRYLYKQHNGVEQEPRATIQREDKTWVEEAEWPAPGTSDTELHLGAGGNTRGSLSLTDS